MRGGGLSPNTTGRYEHQLGVCPFIPNRHTPRCALSMAPTESEPSETSQGSRDRKGEPAWVRKIRRGSKRAWRKTKKRLKRSFSPNASSTLDGSDGENSDVDLKERDDLSVHLSPRDAPGDVGADLHQGSKSFYAYAVDVGPPGHGGNEGTPLLVQQHHGVGGKPPAIESYGGVGVAAAARSRSASLRSDRLGVDNPDIVAAWGGNRVSFVMSDAGEGDSIARRSSRGGVSGSFIASDGAPSKAESDPLLGDAGRAASDDPPVPEAKLKFIYFILCFAYSIYSPFFVLYMKEDVGLSAGQVGAIAALQIVGGYVVGPAVSLVTDRFRIHKWTWLVSCLLCIVPVQMIPLARTFGSALAVALAIAAVNAPMSSILDSATLCFLGSRSHDYGKIRLWGAIGWGLGSLAAGTLVQFFGTAAAFHAFAVCMLAGAALIFTLDFTVMHTKVGEDMDGNAKALTFWRSLLRLIPSWYYVCFLVVAVVAGFGATSLQSLLLLFLSDLGAPDFLEGLVLSVATISELPVFWASGGIIKRLGAHALLMAAMVAFTVSALPNSLPFLASPPLLATPFPSRQCPCVLSDTVPNPAACLLAFLVCAISVGSDATGACFARERFDESVVGAPTAAAPRLYLRWHLDGRCRPRQRAQPGGPRNDRAVPLQLCLQRGRGALREYCGGSVV